MSERKTTAINLRMSQDIKELLRMAAAQEHRTLSNMLEFLVLQHCEQRGLRVSAASSNGLSDSRRRETQ